MVSHLITKEYRGGGKKNKYEELFGIAWEWVGSKLSMCCLSLGEKRETHKQKSQEILRKCRDSPGIILGQSRENSI